jgi:hypothetical protein
MEIGFETNKGGANGNPRINAEFDNITVLHAMHKPPISVHNADNATIYDVKFTNITIENYQAGEGDGWNFLIDIINKKDLGWSTVGSWGSIQNVLVDGVYVLDGKNPNWRFGGDGGSITGTVRNVYFKGSKLNLGNTLGNSSLNFQ